MVCSAGRIFGPAAFRFGTNPPGTPVARDLQLSIDKEFFDLLSKDARRKLALGIDLLHCGLSPELQALVSKLRKEAWNEIGRGKAKA